MKKFWIVVSILLMVMFSITAIAVETCKFTDSFTSDAQVFTSKTLLYGWDVVTDGTYDITMSLYDTAITRSRVEQQRIGLEYVLTTSSEDRTQVFRYPVPIKTTSGAVYMDISYTKVLPAGQGFVFYYLKGK